MFGISRSLSRANVTMARLTGVIATFDYPITPLSQWSTIAIEGH